MENLMMIYRLIERNQSAKTMHHKPCTLSELETFCDCSLDVETCEKKLWPSQLRVWKHHNHLGHQQEARRHFKTYVWVQPAWKCTSANSIKSNIQLRNEQTTTVSGFLLLYRRSAILHIIQPSKPTLMYMYITLIETKAWQWYLI